MIKITCDAELDATLAEIETMIGKVEPGTSRGDRFDALITAAETYEIAHHPIPEPTPEQMAEFRADQETYRHRSAA